MPKGVANSLKRLELIDIIHSDININMDILTVISDLQSEYNEHKDKYKKIYIEEAETKIGYYNEYYINVNIMGVREESDEEYNKRIEKLNKQKELNKNNAKKAKAKAIEDEKKEYERLKKKYGISD